MKNEPIRHHYIPQFILRNFCFNDRSDLYYFDKENLKTSAKNIRDVFMARNLYRDEINSPDEPTKIEKDMARFESEASRAISSEPMRLMRTLWPSVWQFMALFGKSGNRPPGTLLALFGAI